MTDNFKILIFLDILKFFKIFNAKNVTSHVHKFCKIYQNKLKFKKFKNKLSHYDRNFKHVNILLAGYSSK